jgi:hypothetical protein
MITFMARVCILASLRTLSGTKGVYSGMVLLQASGAQSRSMGATRGCEDLCVQRVYTKRMLKNSRKLYVLEYPEMRTVES